MGGARAAKERQRQEPSSKLGLHRLIVLERAKALGKVGKARCWRSKDRAILWRHGLQGHGFAGMK
jgi:hypothetical protein